jgi:DinB superfamily
MPDSRPVVADYIGDLRTTVTSASAVLAAVDEAAAARRPGPGKWSAKEVLGHLVDSAANNHQRFVRAQFQDDLVFQGYDQERWVAVQRYQDAAWPSLIRLWREWNLHLAHVMAAMPDSVRLREHTHHNLHQLAWRPVPAGAPTTLDYFMRDYVGHLHHHLRQIGALLDIAPYA